MTVERVDGRVRVEITLDASSEHNVWCDLSMDVAEGGVFVATYEAVRLGTVVDVALRLPEDDEPTETSGVVRWTREHVDGADAPAGIGIKFVSLSPSAREALGRFAECVREPILFELDEGPIRRRARSSTRPQA